MLRQDSRRGPLESPTERAEPRPMRRGQAILPRDGGASARRAQPAPDFAAPPGYPAPDALPARQR